MVPRIKTQVKERACPAVLSLRPKKFLFGSHIWLCLEPTPSSLLRGHSWQGSGDQMDAGDQAQIGSMQGKCPVHCTIFPTLCNNHFKANKDEDAGPGLVVQKVVGWRQYSSNTPKRISRLEEPQSPSEKECTQILSTGFVKDLSAWKIIESPR